jgi:hypothetical protein
MKKIICILALLTVVTLLINACKKKTSEPPANPFTTTETAKPIAIADAPIAPTFKSIYTKILQPKCGNPSCHDGHFEPDFRTIESAYATMVYHPVVKHTLDGRYTMRVIPANVDSSWLYNRVSTTDAQLGRMPLYKPQLDATELTAIKDWITAGAKDQYDQPAREPNGEPIVNYYFATDSTTGINRADTNRVDSTRSDSPFITHAGKQLSIFVKMSDDHTPVAQFTNVKMKLSHNIDGFPAQVTNTITGAAPPYAWFKGYVFTINTSTLTPNKVYYFRVYMNDGTSTTDTEFPITNMWPWWKNYAAFVVK